jgi:hypothetical protein
MMVCMYVKYVCVCTVYLQQRVSHIVGPCFITSGEILHVKNNRNPKHPWLYFCNCSNFLKKNPKKKKKKKKKKQKKKPSFTIVYCTCGSQTRTGTLLLVMRQEEECEAIDVKLAKAVAIGSNCGKRRSRRRRITVEDGGRLVISNPIQCSTKTGLSTCLQTENGVWNSKQAAASPVICVFFIEDILHRIWRQSIPRLGSTVLPQLQRF